MGRKNLSSMTSVMAAHILHLGYKADQHWSVDFLALYLDDALGARQWVDCDNDSEVTLFCQNITCFGEMKESQTVGVVKDEHSSPSKDDMVILSDSSDEEEVIEGGDGTKVESIPVLVSVAPRTTLTIMNRFRKTQKDALNMIVHTIFERCRGQSSVSLEESFNSADIPLPVYPEMSSHASKIISSIPIGSSWALIATMTTFCEHLPAVRLLASICLERWVANPTVSEYVRRFLSQIVSVLSKSIDRRIDDIVIREIVRIRSKIKPAQQDVYKLTITELAKLGPVIGSVLIASLLEDELATASSSVSMAGGRTDTVKSLNAVLTAVSAYSDYAISKTLGLGISMISDLRSGRNSNDVFRIRVDWTPGTVKLVVDIVIRCIKSINIKDFRFGVFIRSFLPSDHAAGNQLAWALCFD